MAAAKTAVIVKSGNMSLGVNLLDSLVKQEAKALPGFDIEILEMHHNKKIDAPSGTALMLGRAAAEGVPLISPNVRCAAATVTPGHASKAI
jgi:4-hydroxy-tetrahydrodipicolinate reductase